MKKEIIEAIENKKIIEFYYDNHYRIVEPHTFGVSKKGNDTLSAYQIDGSSDKGSVPDWKQFTISKIESMKILNETFIQERDGYTRGDSRMISIYSEL